MGRPGRAQRASLRRRRPIRRAPRRARRSRAGASGPRPTRLNAIVGSAQAQRLVGVRQSARDVARHELDLAQRIDNRTRDGYAHGLGHEPRSRRLCAGAPTGADRPRHSRLPGGRSARRRGPHQRGVSLLNAIGRRERHSSPRRSRSPRSSRCGRATRRRSRLRLRHPTVFVTHRREARRAPLHRGRRRRSTAT